MISLTEIVARGLANPKTSNILTRFPVRTDGHYTYVTLNTSYA